MPHKRTSLGCLFVEVFYLMSHGLQWKLAYERPVGPVGDFCGPFVTRESQRYLNFPYMTCKFTNTSGCAQTENARFALMFSRKKKKMSR